MRKSQARLRLFPILRLAIVCLCFVLTLHKPERETGNEEKHHDEQRILSALVPVASLEPTEVRVVWVWVVVKIGNDDSSQHGHDKRLHHDRNVLEHWMSPRCLQVTVDVQVVVVECQLADVVEHQWHRSGSKKKSPLTPPTKMPLRIPVIQIDIVDLTVLVCRIVWPSGKTDDIAKNGRRETQEAISWDVHEGTPVDKYIYFVDWRKFVGNK